MQRLSAALEAKSRRAAAGRAQLLAEWRAYWARAWFSRSFRVGAVFLPVRPGRPLSAVTPRRGLPMSVVTEQRLRLSASCGSAVRCRPVPDV